MDTKNSGQSGQDPDEVLKNGDDEAPLYERVHVDTVRAWVAVRVQETSYRALAEDLSVGKSTLEKFVKKKANPSKIWYRLRQGYLQDQKERMGSLQDPTDMAILLLEAVSNVPAEERGRAIRALADTLERIHRDTHAPHPDWLPHIREIADEADAAAEQRRLREAEARPPQPGRRGRKTEE